MATYEEQRKMAQRFFDRYLHGQFTVGISPRPEGVKYLGIDAWDATEYAQATYKCIFAENSNISERDFAREMLSRIPVLNNLASSFEQSLKRASGAKEGVAASYVAAFFNYTYDLGLSFRDQVRSFKLNARFIPAWLKSMPKKIGNFTVHYEIWKHPETPLTIEIRNQEGKRVATIGGLLYYEGKQPTIRVTNIQGDPVRKAYEEGRRLFKEKKTKELERFAQAKYAELSRPLGENWRVFFLKEVMAVAKSKGMPVVAELPRRYSHIVPLSTDKEYKRQIRQSKQTYRKAGLTEQPDKTWRFAPKRRRK